MADSTAFILTAAGIAAANEAIFAPIAQHRPLWVDFNWRLIPATAMATLALAALERVSPPFAKGLAILGVMYVLMFPMGNAGSPLDNAAKVLKS